MNRTDRERIEALLRANAVELREDAQNIGGYEICCREQLLRLAADFDTAADKLASPPQPLGATTEQCGTAPIGWSCTRAAGHTGPCAAVPTAPADLLRERAQWYRDGCDGLEDREGYWTSGDLLRDVASDLENALALTPDRLSSSPEAAGWHPIATAPKGGTNIILSDGSLVSEGGWISAADQGAEPEEEFRIAAGWWSLETIEHPTHWQPLPSPPEAAREDK